MMIETIKDTLNKLLEDNGDKGDWDRWASRFVLGIDKTQESIRRAIRVNDKTFTDKSGLTSVEVAWETTHTDLNSWWRDFIVRSYAANAALKWSESIGLSGHDRIVAEEKISEYLGIVKIALDDWP